MLKRRNRYTYTLLLFLLMILLSACQSETATNEHADHAMNTETSVQSAATATPTAKIPDSLIGTYGKNPLLIINKQKGSQVSGYVINFDGKEPASCMTFVADYADATFTGFNYNPLAKLGMEGSFEIHGNELQFNAIPFALDQVNPTVDHALIDRMIKTFKIDE
jgi:hypothetical protein